MENENTIYSGNLFELLNNNELERLEAALSGGILADKSEVEELADTLSQYCSALAAEDGLELAEDFLRMLFLCHDRIPDSRLIRESLFEAALDFIGEAGSQKDFDRAEAYLQRLFNLLAAAAEDTVLSRVCANGTVLTIANYLNCDPAKMKQAKMHNAKLEQLSDQYAGDEVMPAMLAWGKRCFIRETVNSGGSDKAKNTLLELRDFAEKHKRNALVASEYAGTCHICFEGYITRVEDDDEDDYIKLFDVKKMERLTDEMERLHREYYAEYLKWEEIEPSYRFPNYQTNFFDVLYINMIWDLAQKYASNGKHKLLEKCLTRLDAAFHPDAEELYDHVQVQIISQLIAVFAVRRPEEALVLFERQKVLIKKIPDSVCENADWMCSLAEQLIQENAKKHARLIELLTEELKQTAEETDDPHIHSRYARILYNFCFFAPKNAPNTHLEEKLYQYVIDHTVETDIAEAVTALLADKIPALKKDKYDYSDLPEMAYILTNGNQQAVIDTALMSRNYNVFIKAHQEWCDKMGYDADSFKKYTHETTCDIMGYWLCGYEATDKKDENPATQFGAFIDWKEETEDIIRLLVKAGKNLNYPLELDKIVFSGNESTDEALNVIGDFLAARGYALLSLDTQSDCHHLFVIQSRNYKLLMQIAKAAGVNFWSFSKVGDNA